MHTFSADREDASLERESQGSLVGPPRYMCIYIYSSFIKFLSKSGGFTPLHGNFGGRRTNHGILGFPIFRPTRIYCKDGLGIQISFGDLRADELVVYRDYMPGSINSVHKKSVQDGMQQWVSLVVQHFWHDTRLMVSVLQCFWSRATAAS